MGVVISLDRAQKAAPNLKALLNTVSSEMQQVDDILVKRVSSQVPLIPEISQQLIQSGGKRLRPILTLAAADMCDYTGNEHVKLAAAVELMHTATLLHDDVVDESDMRRGIPTARNLHGNQASVLVGDYMLGQAFKMMVETGSLEALSVLSHAASVIAEGEVLQLEAAHNVATSEDDYMQVIRSKTAALFSAAAEVGAIIADKSDAHRAALRSYGTNLGIAFQLIDDALDYSGAQASLGKNIGDDFREGKITLPVILCYRRGNDEERAFWQRTLGEQDYREHDLDHALELILHYNTLEGCFERARHHVSIAKDALGLFSQSQMRSALEDAADFAVNRKF